MAVRAVSGVGCEAPPACPTPADPRSPHAELLSQAWTRCGLTSVARTRSAEAGREVHLHEVWAGAEVAELSVVGDVRLCPSRNRETACTMPACSDGSGSAGTAGRPRGFPLAFDDVDRKPTALNTTPMPSIADHAMMPATGACRPLSRRHTAGAWRGRAQHAPGAVQP